MKESVGGGSTTECESYTTIRLVTIVEQFFQVELPRPLTNGNNTRSSSDLPSGSAALPNPIVDREQYI